MALAFIHGDTFDTRSAAQIARRYTSGSVNAVVTGANTRYNYGQAASGIAILRKDFPATYRYFIIGLAFRLNTSLNGQKLIDVRNVSAIHCTVLLKTDGSFDILGSGGTVHASSAAGIVSLNTWHHICLALDIGNTGNARVFIDGTARATATSQDFQDGADQFAASVLLAVAGTENPLGDDYYIMGGNSTANLYAEVPGPGGGGDLWGSSYMPLADEGSNDWTPSAGTDHYALVDEIPADDNTTYLIGTTAEDTELYTFPPLEPEVGEIMFVQRSFMGQQDDGSAGPQTISNVVKRSGTVYEDTVEHTLASFGTIREFTDPTATDPSTGLPWTSAGFAAMASGFRKKS
jgi:hypothetical protein